MSAAKTQVIAYAYDNPVFDDDDVHARADKTAEDVTKVEIKAAEPGSEPDLKDLFYPDPKLLFTRLKWQFWIVQFLILAHVMIIGYTDPLDNTSKIVQIMVISIQIGMIVVIMMAFFVLTSHTLYIRLGRYDLYLKEYKFFYISFIIELLLFVGAKVLYIVLFIQNVPPLEFWRVKGYLGLWLAQRIVLLIYWLIASYAATQVFHERAYDPEYVVRPT
mmetsp:Transcript_23100/g.50702  ORF Transcript_23100/g.50702 Transcript_23100/m.50702 type:complete len:218 (-) Transcript_23100:489-1142(-)